jgi:hypothetical protein
MRPLNKTTKEIQLRDENINSKICFIFEDFKQIMEDFLLLLTDFKDLELGIC